MDSIGENVGVYSEAKGEYTRQLCQFLVPALLTYFLETVDDVKQKDTDARKLLWNFQNHLKDIPDWNIDRVKRETTRIQNLTKCDYMEELLTAVFIAHTKVLSAIRLSTKQKKLQISIPKLEHFLHRTLSDCARLLWSNVYLFTPTGAAVERQKNLNVVEGLLGEGILQSIRTMLPVKSILREYLHEDTEEEAAKAEEEAAAEAAPEVAPEAAPEVAPEAAPEVAPEAAPEVAPVVAPEVVPVAAPEVAPVAAPVVAPVPEPAPVVAPVPEPAPVVAPVPEPAPVVAPAQTIVVDTEPSVRFTNIDTVFNAMGNSEEVALEELDMDDDMLQFVDASTTALDDKLDYEEL